MRQLNKEQKQEKRNIENELLRERAKTDQLTEIVRIFGLQSSTANMGTPKPVQNNNDLDQFSFDESNWFENVNQQHQLNMDSQRSLRPASDLALEKPQSKQVVIYGNDQPKRDLEESKGYNGNDMAQKYNEILKQVFEKLENIERGNNNIHKQNKDQAASSKRDSQDASDISKTKP